MRRLLLTGLATVVLVADAEAQASKPGAPNNNSNISRQNSIEEFKRFLQARYDDKLPTDRQFVERTTPDDRVTIDESGTVRHRSRAEALASLAKPKAPPMPAEMNFHQSIEDVEVQKYAEVAIVHYRLDIHMVLNREAVLKQLRCTEVFHRKGRAWQSVSRQVTVIPGEIVAAQIDPRLYEEYVGKYQLFPGYVYTVTRNGDKLMFNSKAVGDRELMPETPTSFVEKGLLYRIIFSRDNNGEITSLRLREFPGVEYNAIRIQ